MNIFLKQNTKDVESFNLELIFFFFFGGTFLSREPSMSLQMLFYGCVTRKDLLMKTVPYSKFTHAYLCDESIQRTKRCLQWAWEQSYAVNCLG